MSEPRRPALADLPARPEWDPGGTLDLELVAPDGPSWVTVLSRSGLVLHPDTGAVLVEIIDGTGAVAGEREFVL